MAPLEALGTGMVLMRSPEGENSASVKGKATAARVPPGVPPRSTMMELEWKRACQRVGVGVMDDVADCDGVMVWEGKEPRLFVADTEAVVLALAVREPEGVPGGDTVIEGVLGGVGAAGMMSLRVGAKATPTKKVPAAGVAMTVTVPAEGTMRKRRALLHA